MFPKVWYAYHRWYRQEFKGVSDRKEITKNCSRILSAVIWALVQDNWAHSFLIILASSQNGHLLTYSNTLLGKEGTLIRPRPLKKYTHVLSLGTLVYTINQIIQIRTLMTNSTINSITASHGKRGNTNGYMLIREQSSYYPRKAVGDTWVTPPVFT